ncbi:DUF1861 family protein [Thalassobacillus pellis]|uniref:DUF1861 family protein n=1 Tax=Thalassobacillus pellis TaxID=748008 RepID=UPI001961919E|nr:DUF1861 family protein [Thalassobacillus pellis]MBM7551638.1 hypothetical protein [Thalassobacillus pellis]
MSYRVNDLLADYRENKPSVMAEKLTFTGVGGKDVYNITAPFTDNGKQMIAGRVEERSSEYSEVIFFKKEAGEWTPDEGLPKFQLQDPFVTSIHDQLVFGGVEIFPHPENEGALMWRTVFYKGRDISRLEKFTTGPDGMKDIRLIELPDGKIGVFTRPQGKKGGRGKMGFTAIDKLDELDADLLSQAPLMKEHFLDEEWGGANEIHLLANGRIGVLGHISQFDDQGDRHYYPMIFLYDVQANQISDMEIIAEREDFPPGATKRPDLKDVLFSGGLVRLKNGMAELYVGVSDAEAHKAVISDPFEKFE